MNKYLYILIGLLFLGGVIFVIKSPGKPGQYDAFAQCITDKGAKFYGAFWCPHCQAQKARLGKSAKLLPYIECSTADSKGQLQVCIDASIKTYPTWEFLTGTTTERVEGELELTDLAAKTSCELVKES